LFWLKGKPGSGKSTVTKCAVEYARETFTHERVIYFFFNARGDPLERTVEGMFRSLLHQIAQDVPQPFGSLGSNEITTYNSQGWPSELLKNLFREAVCELSKDAQLACYIDALDEGDEDEVRELLDFLEGVLERANENELGFSVYLASRHYPNISVNHSESFSMDDHEGHHTDISIYVHSKLRCKPASMQRDLAAELIQRSSGVFLWVILVTRDLNKQSDRGNNHRLRSHLQAIPTGLNDLFQRIICAEATSEYTLPALQFASFAHRALRPKELYFAILSITEPSSNCPDLREYVYVSEEIAEDFITFTSKGLLEVVESQNPMISHRKVQFIHESVREYLISSGLRRLNPDLPENAVGEGNLRLARWCQIYLDLSLQHVVVPEIEEQGYCKVITLSLYFPCFEYAWYGILLHSETAAYHGTLVQEPLEAFLKSHLSVHWGPGRDLSQLHSKPSILHVLAYRKCTNLILQQIERHPPHLLHDFINTDCPGGYPNPYTWPGGSCDALQIAVDNNFPDIVELLLSHGAEPNVTHQKCNDHPLHIIASKSVRVREERENVEMIKVLLRYGAKADFRNDVGHTALHKEAAKGHTRIVHLLLQNRADPNTKASDHRTPLHMALSKSKQSVETVRTLLRHGADLNARDITRETALHKGVKSNNVEPCRLLLEHGAAVDVRNRVGETPLHQAARGGMLDISCLLLQHNADVNGYYNADDTALRIAIQHWRFQVVRALLIHGAGVSGLYTHVDGRASLMDALRHTEWNVVRAIVRMVDHVKNIPLASRIQANSTLEKIVMEEGVWEDLPKDSDSDDSFDDSSDDW
jgi:ankyrin repeat protein